MTVESYVYYPSGKEKKLEGPKMFMPLVRPFISFFLYSIVFHFVIICICRQIQVTSGMLSLQNDYIVSHMLYLYCSGNFFMS